MATNLLSHLLYYVNVNKNKKAMPYEQAKVFTSK